MPIAVCDIKCYGYEKRLTECSMIQSCDHDFNFCSHSTDVSIQCCKVYHYASIAIKLTMYLLCR